MSSEYKNIALGGHRGSGCSDAEFFSFRDLAGLPVENTLASIKAAFQTGADFIETDAIMSCDGEILLLHNVKPEDHFFGKTRPLKNLNKLNFESFKDLPTGRSSRGKIATLTELLQLLPELDPQTTPFGLNLEIKGVQGSGQAYENNEFLKNIAKTIERSRYPARRILFSSFCLENILTLSKLIPTANFGILYSEKSTVQAIYSDKQNNFNFNYLPADIKTAGKVTEIWGTDSKLYFIPEITTITPEFIEFSAKHSAGLISWAWQEKLTEDRVKLYQQILLQTKSANLPFYIITDYLKEIKGSAGL